MRELKFRAWFSRKPTWCNQMFYSDAEEAGIGDWFSECFNEQEDVIIMQYTGLKDNNSGEIYEGDIIRWKSLSVNLIYIVEQTDGGWNPFIDDMQTDGAWHYEIIGNIHENPELIQREDEKDD